MLVRIIDKHGAFVEGHRRRFNAEFDLVDVRSFNAKCMIEVTDEIQHREEEAAAEKSAGKKRKDSKPTGSQEVI